MTSPVRLYVPAGTAVQVIEQGVPVPAPTIVSARATPSTLPAGGGSVVIDATLANATQVTLDGAVVTLPVTVNVTASHMFSLVAHGPTAPDAQASIAVTVAVPVDLTITTKALVGRLIVAPWYFGGGSAYDRFQTEQEITGPTTFTVRAFDNGFLPAGALTLQADGVALATVNPSGNFPSANIAFTQAVYDAQSEGWRCLGVAGPAVGTSIDYFVYIRKGATAAPQTLMPVCTSSYTLEQVLTNHKPEGYQRAMVPAAFNPTLQPLTPRLMPALTAPPSRDALVMTLLAPYHPEDEYRPNVSLTGVWNTANRQNYFYSDFSDAIPKWELLDGPRGRGTIICPMAIRPSLRPGGSAKEYVVEPWRVVVVGEDGAIRTLVGWRHNGMPNYWGGAQNLEFVGVWDTSVPAAQRKPFRELWDMTWDQSTLATDPNAPPIGGEQPHLVGPRMFLTDTQNGRIVDCRFSPTDRLAPPTLSVPITGLSEPWGCECIGNVLYVTERLGNKLNAYNKDTFALLWSLPINGATGLRYQDGFLFVGSLPDKKIYKVDVASHAVSVFKDVTAFVNNNSLFINLAISDGTFGPRGMVAMVSWSNANQGYPNLFSPNGSEIMSWQWAGTARPGLPWPGSGSEQALSYASAVGIGDGHMTWGTVQEGLYRASKALATDVQPSAGYAAGAAEYYAKGFHLTNGNRGFGFYGVPQRWGVSANIDAYLQDNGHQKAA